MKQIKGFYSQYIGDFLSRKDSARKGLEREIKEYEDLAGWKSKNYLILKDTCEKFRKKINRICKRYNEILISPIDQFLLETTRNSMLHDSLESFIDFMKRNYMPKKENSSSKAFFQCKALKSNKILKTAQKILKKCSLTLPMHYYPEENPCKVLKNDENDNNPTSYGYLDGVIETLFDRISDLKKENVTKLMKFRALQDLYKILKEMGLTGLYKTYSNVELSYEFEFYDINHKSESPKLNENENNPMIEGFLNRIQEEGSSHKISNKFHQVQGKYMEKIEEYYYKILDRMSVLRTKNDFHGDIALIHVRKGIGFIIEMFYTFRTHYKNFYGMLQDFSKIQSFMSFFMKIKDLSMKENEFAVNFSVLNNDLLNKCLSFLNRNYDSCNENKDFFVDKNEFLVNNESILKKFVEAKNLVEKIFSGKIDQSLFIISDDLFGLKQKLEEISLNLSKSISNDLQNVQNLQVRILISDKFSKIIQENQVLLDSLTEFIEKTKNSCQNQDLLEQKSKNIEKNVETCQKLVQSFSKLFSEYKQKVQSFFSTNEVEDETPITVSFLTNELELTTKYISIFKAFLHESTLIYNTYFSGTNIISSKSLKPNENLISLISLMSLLGKFHEFSLNYNAKFLKSYGKLSSLISLILSNLFYKGFCHTSSENEPKERPENEEEGDYVEGTGIGEGKGQENVSKEIEFEEQVMGTKNEEKPDDENDQKPDQKDKKEEGIDMENDFEGENVSEDEKNPEEEEEEKGNEEKERDEEFSNVDDEVDYDMWNKDEMDESEGENEEEKEQRELEDLDLKMDKLPENKKTETRAKKDEKPKDKQRNLDDFDQDDEEQQREKNELESQEENEDEMEEIDDDKQPRLGDPMKDEEENKEEQEDRMSLEFGEDQEKEEGQSEGGVSNEKNEEFNDPLDQLEKNNDDIEEEANDEKEDQQEENSQIQEQIEEMEIEDDQKEEQDKEEENITSGQNPKENKEKAYGKKNMMSGNQDIINEEDKEKKEKGEGQGDDGGKDLNERVSEKQQENTGFSQEFMKAFIEHTNQIYDEKQMDSFVKDLNVVSEKDKEKESGEINKDLDKNMEFEATEKQEKDQGLTTNLPNAEEKQQNEQKFNEEFEKNEKETDYSKAGKDKNDDKMTEENEKTKDIKRNTQGKDKMDEEPEKIEFKSKEPNDLIWKNKTNDKMEIEKTKEEENLANTLDLMNPKKTTEERKAEIFELIKEWKTNVDDYDKSMKVQ